MFNYELAILGLERMGDEAAVEVLLSALGDNYGDIAVLARRALTRLQNRISNPNLKETVRRALEKEPQPSSQ
jgi:HEAT repeat protein